MAWLGWPLAALELVNRNVNHQRREMSFGEPIAVPPVLERLATTDERPKQTIIAPCGGKPHHPNPLRQRHAAPRNKDKQ